jgi:hypothetical protein
MDCCGFRCGEATWYSHCLFYSQDVGSKNSKLGCLLQRRSRKNPLKSKSNGRRFLGCWRARCKRKKEFFLAACEICQFAHLSRSAGLLFSVDDAVIPHTWRFCQLLESTRADVDPARMSGRGALLAAAFPLWGGPEARRLHLVRGGKGSCRALTLISGGFAEDDLDPEGEVRIAELLATREHR